LFFYVAVTVTTFLISGFLTYLGLLDSNLAKLSGSCGIFAGAGFLPDSGQSRSRNLVQP